MSKSVARCCIETQRAHVDDFSHIETSPPDEVAFYEG